MRGDLGRLIKIIARDQRRGAERERRRKARPARILTDLQRRFIDLFLGESRGNATKAARLAVYRWPNKQGPAMLGHPLVAGEILRRVALETQTMSAPRRCGLMAFGDPRKTYEESTRDILAAMLSGRVG